MIKPDWTDERMISVLGLLANDNYECCVLPCWKDSDDGTHCQFRTQTEDKCLERLRAIVRLALCD